MNKTKFSTILSIDLRDKLINHAIKSGKKIYSIIEEALQKYFKEVKK